MKSSRPIFVLLSVGAFLSACPGGSEICQNRALAGAEKTVTITVKEKKISLRLTKGEVLELKLEMQAGTGFSWQIAKNDDALLKPKGKSSLENIEKPKPGSAQLQVFRFEALAAGTCDLELHYRRPFEKDQPPANTFKLTLHIVTSDSK